MRTPLFQALLPVLYAAGEPVFLQQSPGVGKTHVTHSVAAALQRAARARGADFELRLLRAPYLDIPDVRGLPSLNAEVTHWLRPDWVPAPGTAGILLVDELAAAPASVRKTLTELAEVDPAGTRRCGGHVIPSGWLPVFIGNRLQDKAGAERLESTLVSRLAILSLDTTVGDFMDYGLGGRAVPDFITPCERPPVLNARDPGWSLEPEILAFLQANPDHLNNFEAWLKKSKEARGTDATLLVKDNEPYTCPRSWERLDRVIKVWRHNQVKLRVPLDGALAEYDWLPDELVAAFIGGVSAHFQTFVKLMDKLPSQAEILADPAGAPVPDALDLQWAVAHAAARWTTPENFGRLLAYTERLATTPNFQAFYVKGATRLARDKAAATAAAAGRDPKQEPVPLLRNKTYSEYCIRHADLFV